jgi:hypothetical protein
MSFPLLSCLIALPLAGALLLWLLPERWRVPAAFSNPPAIPRAHRLVVLNRKASVFN